MKGRTVWLRMWFMGAAWGAACGAGLGLLQVWAITGSVLNESDGPMDFVATQIMWTLAALVFGGATGLVLGFSTGLIAGIALEVLLRWLGAQWAVAATIAVVLGTQVAVGMATGDLPLGIVLWGPAITIVPLTLVAQRAARSRTEFRSAPHGRDTLAA